MNKPEENNLMNNADAAGKAASREQRQGNEFGAPLGSAKSGRLSFPSSASWVTVRADPSMADLYHARFAGQRRA